MNSGKFVYVTYIAATPSKVWQALLEGELAKQYWKHEQVSDWTPGSSWKLVANDASRTVKHVGSVLEIDPEKRLVVSWGNVADADPAFYSRMAIDLDTVGETVRMTVTHEALSEDMQGRITIGWPRVCASLKSFLETGRPLVM
jgi:uncharacterized protein YndB with AHSA1/START domain